MMRNVLLGALAAAVTVAALGRKKSDERPPVARQALREMEEWKGRSETDPDVKPTLVKYWRHVLRGKHPAEEFGSNWITKFPWSAAFVSWVAEQAAPGALVPSRSHWGYARHGLHNEVPGKYATHRNGSVRVQPGDIVVRRRTDEPLTFDDLERLPYKPSHGDIVTDVKGRRVAVVGGNVFDSVRERIYTLDADGKITDPRVVAILKLNPNPPVA